MHCFLLLAKCIWLVADLLGAERGPSGRQGQMQWYQTGPAWLFDWISTYIPSGEVDKAGSL